MLAIKELPGTIKNDTSMICSCIAGAENIDIYKKLLEKAGFSNIKITLKENSEEIINSWTNQENIEKYVASCYIEAVK